MQRPGKRELGSLGLLAVILGGWFFAAGFEQPWTIGHISTLVLLAIGLVICGYTLVRR
ncbi:MAG TPA: hypothetical protein VG826_01180 [Pirellulales bacterium]|nr:hypothetical protein [Pirellulales bacterium]